MKFCDMRGSCFAAFPLERHPFTSPDANNFLCAVCARPRCLHASDGFRPRQTPHNVAMDWRALYGGQRFARRLVVT